MIYLNLLNKIFGPKKPLTRNEVDELKQGHSSHELDIKSNDDEFNQDSLEGWDSIDTGVNTAMSSLDSRMKHHLSTTNNTSSDKSNIFLFLGIFCAAMIILILYTYKGNTINDVNSEVAIAQKENDLSQDKLKQELNENKVKDQFKEVDRYVAIKKTEQITKEQLRRIEIVPATNNQTLIEDESKTPKSISALEPKNLNKVPTAKNKGLSYGSAPEVYLNELKSVDYRSIREDKPIQLLQELPLGTPANQEDKEKSKSIDEELITKKIDYIDYLKQSQWLFSKNKFKKALKRYLIIIEQYPEDVNAHFYSGLCYHNLGQYEKAITHFDQSYSISLGNFREEALWFKAKAFLKQGKQQNASTILKSIEEEGGFYSEEAGKLLLSLN
jgi:tetratricopeptide (TPR) repeat protein